MKKITALPANKLRQVTNPKIFKFKTTKELHIPTLFVAQKRALTAVQFGLNIKNQGYNLFAMGPAGVGKRVMITQFLENEAIKKPAPADWCYINNFDDPEKPIAVELPAGLGCEFRKDMQILVDDLHISIPVIFESDEYRARIQKISEEFNQEQERLLKKISTDARKHQLLILPSTEGFTVVPVNQKGEAMTTTDFTKLAEKQRKEKEALITEYTSRLTEFLKQIPRLHKQRHKKENKAKKEFTLLAVGHFIDDMKTKYRKFPAIVKYLNEVQHDIIFNVQDFLKSAELGRLKLANSEQFSSSQYEVNVLVDNTNAEGAPIIYEDLPSYSNLICRIDHIVQYGALFTDFTLIKPGALHKANGGYLIIDAMKIITEPYAWEGLKRALQTQKIITELPERMVGMYSTLSIDPVPIPLDVKVVLLGDRMTYYWLASLDPDFDDLFKVAVDFDEEIERSPENLQAYAQLIATLGTKDKLLPFHRNAVANVIDYGTRIIEDIEKISAHTRPIYDLLREASYCAAQRGAKLVTEGDVQQAITAQENRLERLRTLAYEEIGREIILISTTGERIGQINGLSLLEFANFVFGHPSRITVQVRCGDRYVIDIQREVDLSGPIHSKGVLILTGYLGGKFLRNEPLSLTASLVFEQTYGMIEGDSASAAELCVLLSALAQAPVRQNLAITGSVNQFGEMQAVGGINDKIEGFFDVCRINGLTGDQGVLIPQANVKSLMLKRSLVEAAAIKQFHIYPVNNIDEAITLLTGLPAGKRGKDEKFTKGSIHARVEECLEDFAHARIRKKRIHK